MRRLLLQRPLKTEVTFLLFFLIAAGVTGQEMINTLDHLIPPSPGAAALTRSGSADVSLYAGTPSINIPLWTLRGEVVSVPVSLHYHSSGMKVGEVPGWTGLGWTLQAGGAITRVVRGVADDLPRGYLTTGKSYVRPVPRPFTPYVRWSPAGETYDDQYQMLHEAAYGQIDLEPDIFSYQFNGHSGRFVLDAEGKAFLLAPDDLKIDYERDPAGNIVSWEIIDDRGVHFLFGQNGSAEKTLYHSPNGSPSQTFFSAWRLSSITSPNDEDFFSFHYSEQVEERRSPVSLRRQGNKYPSWDDLYRYSVTTIYEKYLTEIRQYFEGGDLRMTFVPVVLDSFPGGTITALREIIISHPLHDSLDRHFRFDYSFFPSTGCGTAQDYLRPCKRLRLDRITEGAGPLQKPPYLFFYDEQPLPPRGSFSKDLWGYYNGRKNETPVPAVRVINDHDPASLIPLSHMGKGVNFRWFGQVHLSLSYIDEGVWDIDGADRSVDTVAVQAGILKRIVWPTGGTTLLQYEPNRVGYVMMPDQETTLTVTAQNSAAEKKYFSLLFPQEIRLIPLFYRDSVNSGRSPYDSIYIINTTGDNRRIFAVSYGDLESISGGEPLYRLWLEKGRYQLVAKPYSGNSLIIAHLFYHEHDRDMLYRVYSNEYKRQEVTAGAKYFPDDSSYAEVKELFLTEEDDPVVCFSWYFRSYQAPNTVSTATLDHPLTIVQLQDDAGDVLFEHFFPVHDSVPYNETEGYYDRGEKLLVLSPGRYHLLFRPRIPAEAGYLKAVYDRAVKSHPWALAGGVRLKRIAEMDRYNDTVSVKTYSYDLPGRESGGVLMHYPLFWDKPDDIYYLGSTVSYAVFPLEVYSLGRVENPLTQGCHIGYSVVRESVPGNGSTMSYFTSPLDYPDVSQPAFPFATVTSFDWKRGRLKERVTYAEDGMLREHTLTAYKDVNDTLYAVGIPSVKVVQSLPDDIYSCRYVVTLTRAGWDVPLRREQWAYDTAGLHPFHTAEMYEYNPVHYHLQRRITFTSDSGRVEQVYLYPQDADTSLPGIGELLDKHMTGIVVAQETRIDTVPVKGSRVFYGRHGTLVVPDSVQVLEGTQYHARTFFDRYDDRGRLLQYHHRGDVSHAINRDLWGRPVVVADNAVWQASGDYPAAAMVTRYRYDPLFGMTAVEDVNGNVTRYEYDALGRLTVVRDPQERILKTVAYQYRTFLGDTSRPYYQDNTYAPSIAADTIRVDPAQPVRGCPVTLSVEGGTLGTEAQWHWYSDGCGVVPVGTGTQITVYPSGAEHYFVRAEGKVNNTVCRTVTLTSMLPLFQPDPDTLFVAAGGTGRPVVIFSGYTGCEPWEVTTTGEGITITEKNSDNFMVTLAANPYDTTRHGMLVLIAGCLRTVIPVIQKGQAAAGPSLSITYSPSFVTSGTEVTFTATVENGSAPYHYVWERKDVSADVWTSVRDVTRNENSDRVTLTAGHENFTVRCVVTGGDGATTNAAEEVMVTE